MGREREGKEKGKRRESRKRREQKEKGREKRREGKGREKKREEKGREKREKSVLVEYTCLQVPQVRPPSSYGEQPTLSVLFASRY